MQFIRHDRLGFEYIDQSKNFVPQVGGQCLQLYKLKFMLMFFLLISVLILEFSAIKKKLQEIVRRLKETKVSMAEYENFSVNLYNRIRA